MVRILVVVTLLLQACIYARGNLQKTKSGHSNYLHKNRSGYSNYPSSIEAEHERRTKRRRHALIAAPIEILAGVAITAAALYAPAKPSDAGNVTGVLADAGKEIVARILVATAGTALAISGVGDGVLGLIDPIFRSPLIRDDRLVSASEIDTIAPQGSPRFGFHATSVLGSDGVGTDVGIGLAHWITPRVRLRHAATTELNLLFGTADRRLIMSGETIIERAFGREQAGLYPKRSLGLYAAGGWAAIEDRVDVPVARAGIALGMRGVSYRLGTTYAAGERLPSLELGMRLEVRSD